MTTHCLTFDVENWYDGTLHRESYRGPGDGRVLPETRRVLELLGAHGATATFFILGQVAAQHPHLVREIAAAGHEVACHGYDHREVCRQEPGALLSNLVRARLLLQDLSGQPVSGFRAPAWSIDRAALAWAPSIVAEAGFTYDSSVFPMWTPLYGVAGAPRWPWYHALPDGRRLVEFPPAVASFLGDLVRLPYAGGIYWRVMPHRVVRRLVAAAAEPLVLYLHPWELAPGPASDLAAMPLLPRLYLSTGRKRAERALREMLKAFEFGPIQRVLAQWIT